MHCTQATVYSACTTLLHALECVRQVWSGGAVPETQNLQNNHLLPDLEGAAQTLKSGSVEASRFEIVTLQQSPITIFWAHSGYFEL